MLTTLGESSSRNQPASMITENLWDWNKVLVNKCAFVSPALETLQSELSPVASSLGQRCRGQVTPWWAPRRLFPNNHRAKRAGARKGGVSFLLFSPLFLLLLRGAASSQVGQVCPALLHRWGAVKICLSFFNAARQVCRVFVPVFVICWVLAGIARGLSEIKFLRGCLLVFLIECSAQGMCIQISFCSVLQLLPLSSGKAE